MILLLALAVGLVLADSSVVTLALPDILREFSTSVGTVAWVLIAFNLALALAALPGSRLARSRPRQALIASIVLFALASAACAAASSIAMLIGARVAQGVLGAVVVAAALELMSARAGPRPAVALWAAAGVLGAAVGPAAGGLLTEAFSWQVMFALQVPVALIALAGVRGATAAQAPPRAALPARGGRPGLHGLVALALVSAALSAALFLLVVLLIEGWRHSPAEAAVTVSVMPVAALLAARWARTRDVGLTPALAGCLLIAGGLAALGLLPGAGPEWTLAPQLAIGLGLGLALAVLVGETVGGTSEGRTQAPGEGQVPTEPAAWTIAARHAGIVAGLLILTPIFTAGLHDARLPAERAGLSTLLDAPLSLVTKLDLARALGSTVEGADNELPDLGHGFAAVRAPAAEGPAIARLRGSLDDQLDRAGTDAFSRSFLVAALLALLAAGVVAFDARRVRAAGATGGGAHANGADPAVGRLAVAASAAGAAAALLVAAYIALGGGGYRPQAVADPCAARPRPARVETVQLALLAALDGGGCRLHTSREDLLLPLLAGTRPPGVSERQLVDAMGAGVDRARREHALGDVEASALKLALSTRGSVAILGLLLGR